MNKFAESYPEGDRYQRIIADIEKKACLYSSADVARVEAAYDQTLPELKGYETQILLDNEQEESVRLFLQQEAAKTDYTPRKLYLPKSGDLIWSSQSSVEWEARYYEPKIVASLEPVDDEEISWAVVGSLDVPEVADSYWECGAPVSLIKRHNTKGWYHEEFKKVFKLDWSQYFTRSLNNNNSVDEVLCELVPVKYFKTTFAEYEDTVEGEARRRIDITLSTEVAKNVVSRDIRKTILRTAEQGVDGTQFIDLLDSPEMKVKTLAELSNLKDDPFLADRALTMVLDIQDPKQRVKSIDHLFECRASLTEQHLERLTASTRDSKELIKIYTLISTSRAEKANYCFEKIYDVITRNYAGPKRNAELAKLCEQVIRVDPVYARRVLAELPSGVKKQSLENMISATELEQIEKEILGFGSDLSYLDLGENPAREIDEKQLISLTESHLSDYELSRDVSFLARAILVGKSIADQKKKQEIFRKIATGLIDDSLPGDDS